jgi:hypothetical protein
MKIKTSEATGPALDWLVAKCEGKFKSFNFYLHESTGAFMLESGDVSFLYSPSMQWKDGGPIIEREWLCVDRLMNGAWVATKRTDTGDSMLFAQIGPTPLIAAMRCYVASKLGDEVEVPEELK